MCMCEGRPRVVTSPLQGANVYRDGRDPNHRATAAASSGVTIAARQGPKRFSRNRKHTTGAPFEQACLVCSGTGSYSFAARE